MTPILEADGGIPDPAAERAVCPSDTEFYLRLSTEWQNYWLNLPPGEPYNDEPGAGGGVWNAFSVVVEPEDIGVPVVDTETDMMEVLVAHAEVRVVAHDRGGGRLVGDHGPGVVPHIVRTFADEMIDGRGGAPGQGHPL